MVKRHSFKKRPVVCMVWWNSWKFGTKAKINSRKVGNVCGVSGFFQFLDRPQIFFVTKRKQPYILSSHFGLSIIRISMRTLAIALVV